MNLQISYTSGLPMYEQIEEGIRKAILSGELKNHDLLPSVRQLAKDMNVSMITTKRAYTDLEQEGLLYTISGKGTFVRSENLDEIKNARRTELMDEFEEQLSAMKNAGIDREEIFKMINTVYGEESDDEQ